jgi:anti-sigma-K factor RskA
MTHSEMDELYELYVLGALEPEEATEIDGHVAIQCSHCLENVRKALGTTSALAELADPLPPPVNVRKRLVAALKPESETRRWSWAIPGLAAACLCLLAVVYWSNSRLQSTRTRLERMAGERDQLRTAVEILSRTDTRTIQFGPSNGGAHGRVLVNPKGGFVMVGSALPEIAQDKTFELWLVPANGQAPVPAGLFRSDNAGPFVHVSQQSVDPSKIAAVAVSVEPRAGSPAPTTKPFLVVPLS